MSDVDALNYPYIHIRDVDWLKRTLLIFPHVVRITPGNLSEFDAEEVRPFIFIEGRRGPLLRPARLFDKHVVSAQQKLLEKLQQDLDLHGPNLKRKFGRQAARKARKPKDPSYQIHGRKMLGELAHLLEMNELAWRPDPPEADGPEYLEFHPRIGEAVMTTLALACAENEGLEVVTEFPELHGRVISQTTKSVYEHLLWDQTPKPAGPITGDEALNFLVYQRCDPSMLTPERIQALNCEWGAIGALRDELQKTAQNTNPKSISSEHLRQKYLDDIVSDVMRRWHRDKANLSNFTKDIFGKGKLSQPARLLEKIVEKAFTPALGFGGAGAMGSQLAPTIMGSLTTGALIGTTAGFAIGLIAFGANTWSERQERAHSSPFRYLTMAHKQGVSFVVGPR